MVISVHCLLGWSVLSDIFKGGLLQGLWTIALFCGIIGLFMLAMFVLRRLLDRSTWPDFLR